MPSLKSDFLQIMQERGFLHQATHLESLDALMSQKKIATYIGFDCTAPSLHVGSLMQIMILRWLQKCGHCPIVLMGGGTTKVGDPSGKDESRKLLDDAQIQANMAGIKSVLKKYLSFEETGGNARMVNNDDWLKELNYISFLREYGRHFSINRMLSMDSVKLRLEREQNLSFLEFNYMILQAYDFVELHKRYDCRLQIGGSDQWGNIVNGVELNRRMYGDTVEITDNGDAKNIFGLTTPLLATASGTKMGKTTSGAVWLSAELLSSFDYWQFWRNTEDRDVGRFLRFFTELSLDEIKRLAALQGAEINEAKKILANEATMLCHGQRAATAAAETARKTFDEGGVGDNLKTIFIERSALEAGIPAYELFYSTGMKDSKSGARKLIEGGGGRINDEKITDPRWLITIACLTSEGYIKLSSGKKQHLLVKFKD
jgi:tyrosyl-tRNA synthetase